MMKITKGSFCRYILRNTIEFSRLKARNISSAPLFKKRNQAIPLYLWAFLNYLYSLKCGLGPTFVLYGHILLIKPE